MYLGCTLDFTSRSCPFGRHDGQGRDEHLLPRTNAILTLVRERIPRRFGLDPVRDIQVLCPMNRGGAGARSLNVELQAALNPAGEKQVERFGWTFSPGDKVMQIENDYDKDVYTGISDLPALDGPFIHPKAAQRPKLLFVTAPSRFRGRQLSPW